MKPFPSKSRTVRQCFFGLCLAALTAHPVQAEDVKLEKGDFLAIIGDSITEQKMYSAFMEEYILACQAGSGIQASQFGWGGETTGNLLARVTNDVLSFKPTAATLSYGMNDGGYIPTDEKRLAKYKADLEGDLEKMKAAGVKDIIVGTAGAVDPATFKTFFGTKADVYNKTLADFGETGKEVAAKAGVGFADVHSLMMDVMTKAKAKYGQDYVLAGKDGIHPGDNGHLVMAYAYLKALGFDGNIAELTYDMGNGTATASAGHKVTGTMENGFAVESSRYPFCFKGDPTKPDATSGVIEFFPFNEDLNRFTLKVKNPVGEKLKVTWGDKSKEFDAAALMKGVNLAAEFIDNPFSKPFAAVHEAVLRQQRYETPMMKEMLHNLPEWGKAPGQEAGLEALKSAMIQTDAEFRTSAAASVQPVRYEIKVEPVR